MQFDVYLSKQLLLRVARDGSACYLKIKDEYKDQPVSEDEMLELLSKAGVIYGFENAKKVRKQDEEFILIAAADDSFSTPEIDYYYKIPTLENPQLEDLKEMHFIVSNKVIGSLELTKRENSSLNIFGKPNINKEKINVDIDENFMIQSDSIISLHHGYLFKDKTGKIRLLRNLIEKNDVFRQKIYLNIKATFEKDILDSEIVSTEDITLRGGMRDCDLIYSEKSISASTIDGSYVVAKENIIFSKQVSDSEVIAGKKIIGGKGSKIYSGKLISGETIDVYDVQNMGKTSMEISIAPFEKELLHLIDKNKIKSNKRKIKTIIEKEFYNFGYTNKSPEINVENLLKPNTYIRIYNKSYKSKKEEHGFHFS